MKKCHNWEPPEDAWWEKPYEIATDSTFSIGQSYENEPAMDIYCKLCNGREFEVGQGSYFTALRCTTCMWEVCVHEG